MCPIITEALEYASVIAFDKINRRKFVVSGCHAQLNYEVKDLNWFKMLRF